MFQKKCIYLLVILMGVAVANSSPVFAQAEKCVVTEKQVEYFAKNIQALKDGNKKVSKKLPVCMRDIINERQVEQKGYNFNNGQEGTRRVCKIIDPDCEKNAIDWLLSCLRQNVYTNNRGDRFIREEQEAKCQKGYDVRLNKCPRVRVPCGSIVTPDDGGDDTGGIPREW